MNLDALLTTLRERGVTLTTDGGQLRVRPASKVDGLTLELLRQHKAALLALLQPARTPGDDGCPDHWLHIPMLPPKGSSISADDAHGGRYRVKLFGRWYLVRCEPTISPTHVRVTDQDAVRRMFANLHEFYRWAWAETYAQALRFREVN
jgi:hypothetical protein